MVERVILHGLLQKAKLDAEAVKVKAFPGGKGFRVWRQTKVGWTFVAEMVSAEDVEDFIVAQLTQVEGVDAPR